jgi:hypothetical protein
MDSDVRELFRASFPEATKAIEKKLCTQGMALAMFDSFKTGYGLGLQKKKLK